MHWRYCSLALSHRILFFVTMHHWNRMIAMVTTCYHWICQRLSAWQPMCLPLTIDNKVVSTAIFYFSREWTDQWSFYWRIESLIVRSPKVKAFCRWIIRNIYNICVLLRKCEYKLRPYVNPLHPCATFLYPSTHTVLNKMANILFYW